MISERVQYYVGNIVDSIVLICRYVDTCCQVIPAIPIVSGPLLTAALELSSVTVTPGFAGTVGGLSPDTGAWWAQ